MKRQFDETERKVTERNLSKRKEELKELEGNLEYNKSLLEKIIQTREHDDKWRDYLRQVKDKEVGKINKGLTRGIKELKELITISEKQLTEGVEIKDAVGVS